MDSVIEVEGLHKRYGELVAVRDISFTVRRGEIFGLLGPNGAGKTTTVECLQGLRRRDHGRVSVPGLDPSRSKGELRQRIGSQLQHAALPDRLRVAEAIDLFGSLAEQPVPTPELLDQWNLGPLADRAFAKLSGGQQQRLFIALALVNSPELVFLDELTTGLDPASRRATWEHVRTVRDGGATVVLVTHFMEEAEYLCDRIAIVDQGAIAALDTPARLATGHNAPVTITFSADQTDVAFLSGLASVESVERRSDRVVISGSPEAAIDVAAALAEHGMRPDDYRTHYPNLEDAFLRLTGSRMEE